MTMQSSAKVIRERLSLIGKTPVDLARELDVSPAIVRGVLSGHFNGKRGDAHKVAVALGLKDGVVVGEGTSIADALKVVA